MIDTGG